MSVDELRRHFAYDPASGVLTWNVNRAPAIKRGDVAGSLRTSGYTQVIFKGKALAAHRIAWAMQTGHWPSGDVDHKNGKKSDNRFDNLRDVPEAINVQNLQGAYAHSVSGVLGVSPRRDGRWVAQIQVAKKKIHLGLFETIAEASAAYMTARRSMFEGNTI